MTSLPSRPLFLTGMMASGKTTLGRALAERTGLPCFDLDEILSSEQGQSISALFQRHGELGFRALEAACLSRIVQTAEAPYILSLGGGSLLDRRARLKLLEVGVVAHLRAPTHILAERCSESKERPLINIPTDTNGAAPLDTSDILENIWQQRASGYQEAHAELDSSDLSPSGLNGLAERCLSVWRRSPIAVADGAASYRVEVLSGRLEESLTETLIELAPSHVVWVSDENLARHYAGELPRWQRSGSKNISHSEIILPAGEHTKALPGLSQIYEHCAAHQVDRRGLMIGFGGGVVTDLTGFAAATWLRGIRWLAAPTSLLGMVDASVGGKTAIDWQNAKNSVGAFWQPSRVLCETELLKTEPERGLRSALAELVKTALIGDPALFQELLAVESPAQNPSAQPWQRWVSRSVSVKARIVSRDPREGAERAWLNLGHTLGHALETETKFQVLTHGEAVSLGLVAALYLGEQLGHTPPSLVDQTVSCLRRLGLPTQIGEEQLNLALQWLHYDKKRVGSSLRFVLARAPGDVFIQPLPLSELSQALKGLAPRLAKPGRS